MYFFQSYWKQQSDVLALFLFSHVAQSKFFFVLIILKSLFKFYI